jgi:hypothetical protein
LSYRSERTVSVRGVQVEVEELPALREAIAALYDLARSGVGGVADTRHQDAFAFLELAAKAGNPVPVAGYPKLLEEIDAATAANGL